MSYKNIFISMLELIRNEQRLVYRSFTGALAFAAMAVLYSTIALLLKSVYQVNDLIIGLVSLVGIFGAVATKHMGKIADRGYTNQITLVGLIILFTGWAFLYFGQFSFISYVVGFGVLNFGLACIHSSNQNIIFRLREDSKSRINSIYMTMYFIGGAIGSATGVYAWHHGGWIMCCVAGVILVMLTSLFAFLDHTFVNKHAS